MKRRLIAALCLTAIILCMVGCSEKEEKTSTITGMVMSVDGTVVSLREFNGNFQGGNRGNGQGQRPSGSENSQRPSKTPDGQSSASPEGNFTFPEGFTMPEGEFTRPEGGSERPEGGNNRPGGNFTRPEGNFTLPEGATMPESDFTRPAGGNRPNSGGNQAEATTVDLKNAHISIQDGDIKAAGSMSDIKVGSFLTITLNSKGEATEVLVTSMGGFGGNGFGGFGGKGFGGGKGNRDNNSQDNNQGSNDQTA